MIDYKISLDGDNGAVTIWVDTETHEIIREPALEAHGEWLSIRPKRLYADDYKESQ